MTYSVSVNCFVLLRPTLGERIKWKIEAKRHTGPHGTPFCRAGDRVRVGWGWGRELLHNIEQGRESSD